MNSDKRDKRVNGNNGKVVKYRCKHELGGFIKDGRLVCIICKEHLRYGVNI